MLECFPEAGCDDAAHTTTALYTSRADYNPSEVVLIEAEVSSGGDTASEASSASAAAFSGNGGDHDRQKEQPHLAAKEKLHLVAAGAGVVHRFSVPPEAHDTFQIAYLDWIGVLDEHRGNGLGRFVSLQALRSMAVRGIAYATLWTQPERTAAIALYESIGFVRLGACLHLHKDL
jgi:ribosomal protein S18 acetylase RimI-like enzyme